ncbi:MAG: hypothetical protein AAF404_04100 [Pseudomonadota bacterium]
MQRWINRTATMALFSAALAMVGCGGGGDNNPDSDGDGVADSADAFPNDPAETTDTDGDGIGDNADTDDDADGVPDIEDVNPLDTDNDTIPNAIDEDDDDDGVPDAEDAFPLDSSESFDTDGDGIGDNADPDTQMPPPDGNTDDTITTANGNGESFQCIANPSVNGAAFIDVTFSGTLDGDYNIRDNSVGCGGFGMANSYSMSFAFPDPGNPDGQNVNMLVEVDGALAVGDDVPAGGTLSLSLSENPARGGIFDLQNCTVSITSIGTLSGQANGDVFLPTGTLDCERAVLSILTSVITGAQPDIVFDTPMEFLGAVGIIAP